MFFATFYSKLTYKYKKQAMKKLIILALSTLALSLQSQSIIITAITPTIVCPLDTVTISFKWDRVPGTSVFRLTPNVGQMRGYVYNNNKVFYSLPKTLEGTDTIYHIKVVIPRFFPSGPATLDPTTGVLTDLSICFDVGLNEYELESLEAVYYDLQGNITELKPNVVLIKKIGNMTKKVLIIE